jgi:PadR family transcriptional regulator, regulatory protein PadR
MQDSRIASSSRLGEGTMTPPTVNPEELKGHLDALILAVIASQPAHGYLVIESLRARSAGTLALPEGTVYPALHRLEQKGFLRSDWSDQSGRRRRTYRITALGERELEASRQRWDVFSRAIAEVLGVEPPGA